MNVKWKLAGLLMVVLALFAAAGCGSKGKDLVGIWRLSSVNGAQLDAHSKGAGELPGFELRDTGTFTMPAFGTSGTYTVDGNTLTMHAEKYNNQSKDEFMKEMAQKHPNDAAMQKLGEQLFADFVLQLDADGKTLTAKSGQNSQSFRRVATRTPSGN
jgi:hypothetical protein